MSTYCDSIPIAGLLILLRNIFTLIEIITPILLIIYLSIEIIKLVNDPDNKKAKKGIYNKVIALIIIFMIPTLINILMYTLGDNTNISACWNNKEVKYNSKYINTNDNKKNILQNQNDYEKGEVSTKLTDDSSSNIPNEVISKAKYSDLSITIVDDSGQILAKRKPDLLREGGSTTKVFTGLAAVKLLDPKNDIIVSTEYASKMPYMGDPDVKVGEKLTVTKAATKDFPGSSNITTANIAIAIGKKYHNSNSDKEAYNEGMNEINKYIKKIGCTKTKLVSSSGVNYNYNKGKWGEFDNNGISKGEYGITSNDLALVTIEAMNDKYFASGIKGRNNNGLYFIKSGTQKYKHGVWGFNHKGKRYYLVILGFNFAKEGDLRNEISQSVYNWAIKSLI